LRVGEDQRERLGVGHRRDICQRFDAAPGERGLISAELAPDGLPDRGLVRGLGHVDPEQPHRLQALSNRVLELPLMRQERRAQIAHGHPLEQASRVLLEQVDGRHPRRGVAREIAAFGLDQLCRISLVGVVLPAFRSEQPMRHLGELQSSRVRSRGFGAAAGAQVHPGEL
jgi:hypothetical protein